MTLYKQKAYAYFPGCSMVTSAKESNKSLISVTKKLGIDLIELPDWNCCGSSSTHSINHDLAVELAARNIFLVPSNLSLVVACPSCYIRLCQGFYKIKSSKTLIEKFEKRWNRKFNSDLKIIHLFKLLDEIDLTERINNSRIFENIKYVPYYGCMLSKPIDIPKEENYNGTIESIMEKMGAKTINWSSMQKCCGTFLSVTHPKSITPVINNIVEEAVNYYADLIVTACAMCHMNLEIRCDLKKKLPVVHLSEMIAIALGSESYKKWFSRHLVDPFPVLKEKNVF